MSECAETYERHLRIIHSTTAMPVESAKRKRDVEPEQVETKVRKKTHINIRTMIKNNMFPPLATDDISWKVTIKSGHSFLTDTGQLDPVLAAFWWKGQWIASPNKLLLHVCLKIKEDQIVMD